LPPHSACHPPATSPHRSTDHARHSPHRQQHRESECIGRDLQVEIDPTVDYERDDPHPHPEGNAPCERVGALVLGFQGNEQRRQHQQPEDAGADCSGLHQNLGIVVVRVIEIADQFLRPVAREDYPLLNIGCGEDQTITELARTVAQALGFRGELRYDATKPDGTPQKLLDISRIRSLGWRPRIGLREGIAHTYRELLEARTLTP
jgi:hypothetical protein